MPLEELRTFAEVLDRIKAAYVEPVDDKTLLENAIKGMLSNLDPHSAYLEPEAFRDLQESTSGEFGGLGIELGSEDGFLKVVSPIDDTPASAAGIQPGDLIVKINGQPTKGLSLMEAVEKMRGKAGTDIELTLLREGGKPFDVELTRAVIKVKSVKSQLRCAAMASGVSAYATHSSSSTQKKRVRTRSSRPSSGETARHSQ